MSKLKDKQFKSKGELKPFLKRLLTYSFRYPKWVAGFTVCVLIVALVEAGFPLVWRSLLDSTIVPMMNANKLSGIMNVGLADVWPYIVLMAVLGTILSLAVFGFIRFAGRIQEFVMYDMREQLFIKLQELSFSF